MEKSRTLAILLIMLVLISTALVSGCTNPFDTCESRHERCITDCESRDNFLQTAACKWDCEGQYAKCHN